MVHRGVTMRTASAVSVDGAMTSSYSDVDWRARLEAVRDRAGDLPGLACLGMLLDHPGEPVSALALEMEFRQPDTACARAAAGLHDARERACVYVACELTTAITLVTEHDPALGEHLRASITAGQFCRYDP